MSEPQLTFIAFIFSLASSAAIHFGDIPDPVTGGKAEPNLEGAAQMIEILTLLEQKTRGNLTAEERQLLEQVLYELRMRFVEAKAGEKRIIIIWPEREDHRLIRRERDLQRIAEPRPAAVKPRLRIEAHHLKILRPPLDAEAVIKPQGHGLRHDPGVAERHQSPALFPMSIAVRLARHHLIIREMRNLSFPPGRRQDGRGLLQQWTRFAATIAGTAPMPSNAAHQDRQDSDRAAGTHARAGR